MATRPRHSIIPHWGTTAGCANAQSYEDRGMPSSSFSEKSKCKTYKSDKIAFTLNWTSLNKPTPEFQKNCQKKILHTLT